MHAPPLALPRLLVLAVAACGAPEEDGEPDPEPRALVVASAWVLAPPARDLFVAAKPSAIECAPEDGYDVTDFGGSPAFEVHTDRCNYLTVEQPLLDDVAAGELVKVRMWHFELRAPEPAVGHAGVGIEGEVHWAYEVEIPADAALVASGWITDRELAAGTLIQFHVDNHGVNSWNLLEITAEPG